MVSETTGLALGAYFISQQIVTYAITDATSSIYTSISNIFCYSSYVDNVILELDVQTKLKATETILEEIGSLTFNTCPKTIHLCIENIHDMILNIKADFYCIEQKIKLHREKWLSGYRSLGVVRELKLLTLHSKLLDNRYDMLIKTLALTSIENIKNV